MRARYLAERHEIAARYVEWEIVGPAEIRGGHSGHFNPWRPAEGQQAAEQSPSADVSPALRDDERPLVLLFLRRYATWCARRRRFAQMESAARLYRQVSRPNA